MNFRLTSSDPWCGTFSTSARRVAPRLTSSFSIAALTSPVSKAVTFPYTTRRTTECPLIVWAEEILASFPPSSGRTGVLSPSRSTWGPEHGDLHVTEEVERVNALIVQPADARVGSRR